MAAAKVMSQSAQLRDGREHQQFGVAVLAQRLNDVDGGRGGVHKHLVSGACELTFAHFQRLAASS
jgi:hypothetical protein